MADCQLLAMLTDDYPDYHPCQILPEVSKRKTTIIPGLLSIARDYAEHNKGVGTFAAACLYLLAEFRVADAVPLLLRICPGIDGRRYSIFQSCESLASDLGALLASMNQDPGFLFRGAIAPKDGPYAQAAAMDALGILVAWGEVSRRRVIPYVRRLLTEIPEEECPDPVVWSAWDVVSSLLPKRECLRQRKQAYEKNLIDDFEMDDCNLEDRLARWNRLHPPLENVAAQLAFAPEDKKWVLNRVRNVNGWRTHGASQELATTLTIASPGEQKQRGLSHAASNEANQTREIPFSRSGSDEQPLRSTPSLSDDTPIICSMTPKPITVTKIGRNKPCPCGSGKKYKKCCLMGSSMPGIPAVEKHS